MKIKHLLLGAGILAGSFMLRAQSSLTIEAAQNITNFRFENSSGEKDKTYLANYSGGYALGYKYALENGMFFTGKLGMRQAGANYEFDAISYAWDFKYFETRLGIGYNYSFGKFGAHISVSPYFGYMLRGIQRLNNEDFNLKNSGEIKKSDIGLFISPGANYSVNDNISVNIDLNNMFGLTDFEIDDTQKSKNTLFGLSLGLSFLIQ